MRRGWLMVAWIVATTGAIGSLVGLSRAQPETYSGVVQLFAVFWYVLLAALAMVITAAAVSRYWERDE